jgi:CheY-like chemotaxis protein
MKTILLVEDDVTFQFLAQTLLRMVGIAKEKIYTASNGMHALDLLKDYYSGSRGLPDVILLDLNMPVLDGFGFLGAFAELDLPDKHKVKIVVVTSSYDSGDIRRARELGASEFSVDRAPLAVLNE